MKITDYNKLAACIPLDQMAGVVTGQVGCDADGFGDEVKTPGGQIRSRNPLPLRVVTKEMISQDHFTDFAGRRIGDLAVVGLLARKSGQSRNNTARWVVRCVCGTYETRSAKLLKRLLAKETAPDEDMCEECHHARYTRARYSHRRKTG